jgi:predicted ATPase
MHFCWTARAKVGLSSAAMLTELSLNQYRTHAATRIPLQRFTLLIGPNGVGKSTALEALELFGKLYEHPPAHVFTGKHALSHLVRRGATQGAELKIEVRGSTKGKDWKAWVTGPLEDKNGKTPVRGDWAPHSRNAPGRLPLPGRLPGPLLDCPYGHELFRNAVKLKLNPLRLAEPSTSDEEIPVLKADGFGLATVLSTLKVDSTERFEALVKAACTIVPNLRAIRIKRTRVERKGERAITVEKQQVLIPEQALVIADEILLDFEDATDIPAHAASEGTLIMLGILATLYGPAAPCLLLLDDIERALHPTAQQALVRALRQILDVTTETQIVATSHSPLIVDAFEPHDVVVVGRRPDGQVVARPFSEHPKAKLMEVLTSGELWSAEGEDWVSDA